MRKYSFAYTYEASLAPNKYKMGFLNKKKSSDINNLDQLAAEKSRDQQAAEKEALKQAMRQKRAEQKIEDAEYDAMIKENIRQYKEEYEVSKVKLQELKASYEEAKAKFEAWALEHPELVVQDEEEVEE